MRQIRCVNWIPKLIYKREFSIDSRFSHNNKLVDVIDSSIKGIKIISMKNSTTNTLNKPFLKDILNTFTELCDPKKDDCQGIVLTSSISGVFSTGIDLNILYTNLERDSFTSYWNEIQKLYLTLNTLPVPLVSAINGDTSGFGCILALASDYRIMAKKGGKKDDKDSIFKIGINISKYGFTVPPSFAALITHVIGYRKCEELLQLGELINAPMAKSIGLVDETVENADDILFLALERAKEFANIPPWSYWNVKDESRKKLVAPLCTPALRTADTLYYYEMLQNPEVRQNLEKLVVNEE